MNSEPIWVRDSALLNSLVRNTYNTMSPEERTELLVQRDIEIDILKAALKPFSKGDTTGKDGLITIKGSFTAEDFRRAAEALREKP